MDEKGESAFFSTPAGSARFAFHANYSLYKMSEIDIIASRSRFEAKRGTRARYLPSAHPASVRSLLLNKILSYSIPFYMQMLRVVQAGCRSLFRTRKRLPEDPSVS